MVKDNEISEKRSRAGKIGGEKSLGKTRHTPKENSSKDADFCPDFASDFAQANSQANSHFASDFAQANIQANAQAKSQNAQTEAQTGDQKAVATVVAGEDNIYINNIYNIEDKNKSNKGGVGEKEGKGKGERKKSGAFVPPTVEDVTGYCAGRKNSVDAERFVNFYTSKGWMIGKNRMKDWRAAVRTWERSGNGSVSAISESAHFGGERNLKNDDRWGKK
jgi:hypothetical protein